MSARQMRVYARAQRIKLVFDWTWSVVEAFDTGGAKLWSRPIYYVEQQIIDGEVL